MYLTARVYDNTILLQDIGSTSDLLGAFYEGECVGLVEAAEVPAFFGGGYAFRLPIFSNNETGEVIDFQF